MAGEKIDLYGCTCARFHWFPQGYIIMPYGSPTLDQRERLIMDANTSVILDQKSWAITPKGEDYQHAKLRVLSLIDKTTIYAVRLKQYAYEVTEARIYSLPLSNHTAILNSKARNCVMLFLTPSEAKEWATQQGAKNIIFETLNSLS
jgi:hypothetical protein